MCLLAKPIPVLYEDDAYVVFDKPAGLLVIPSPKKETRTLVNLVNDQARRKPGEPKLYPCHRLDRDTSGVILFARGKKHQQDMMALFRQRALRKMYVAFVHGKMEKTQGTFNASIRSWDKRRYDPASLPQQAITRFQVKAVYPRFSYLDVELVTGRTNQIRIHCAQAGYPLVGERKYAIAKKYPLKFRRVALHAFSLEWLHPHTKKNIIVQSPLPQDMRSLIANHPGPK